MNRLVNPKVVQACTVVLSDWERLPARTIKSAITLLHRIAFGCKVPIMLFQVWITLFTIYLSPCLSSSLRFFVTFSSLFSLITVILVLVFPLSTHKQQEQHLNSVVYWGPDNDRYGTIEVFSLHRCHIFQSRFSRYTFPSHLTIMMMPVTSYCMCYIYI